MILPYRQAVIILYMFYHGTYAPRDFQNVVLIYMYWWSLYVIKVNTHVQKVLT